MQMLLSLFDDEPTTSAQPVCLRVVSAPEPSADVRITHPHVGANGDLQTIFAEMHASHSDPVPELTEAEKEEVRLWWPLSKVYETYLADWRERQRRDGKIETGTLQKERQTLRCFAAWDSDPARAPKTWPRGLKWTGLPTGHLAQKYLEAWIRDHLSAGYAEGTMAGRWAHLRTILNMLKRMDILSDVPTVELSAVVEGFQREAGLDEDLVPTTYTPQMLVEVYRRLHEPDLRAAWVLGVNCGPRTVDLFRMKYGSNVRGLCGDRPEVVYRAKKTGKVHWIPLHPYTVAHLRRLVALHGHLDPRDPDGPVFPRLTSRAKDPERSKPARRRNARIKQVLEQLGLSVEGDYEKPWQVLRSTCNSLLNNHRPGAGALVTHGKDLDVSSQHYWNHFPLLVEAVKTMPMPEEFGNL